MVFSYYGSKSGLASKYPIPNYDAIVEPFAGAAHYSLLYYARDVWINDKYEAIYRIWKWIQNATRADVESLPELELGDDLRKIKWLSDEERLLLGFAVGKGRQSPGNVVTPRAADSYDGGGCSQVRRIKQRLRRIVGRIDHWKITNLDWYRIGNIRATWFIDPPYQHGGECYIHSDVDYPRLLDWIKHRRGETITCENSDNTWLDWSRPLRTMAGSRYTTTEVMRYKTRVSIPV